MASRKDTSSNEAAAATPPDERVYAAITSALLHGKLAPGAQLVERELAAAFDCTRGTIRKVLARLGAEGKLTLEANRGAFVPSPLAPRVLATVHPSSILRAPDAAARHREMQRFVDDLRAVARALSSE